MPWPGWPQVVQCWLVGSWGLNWVGPDWCLDGRPRKFRVAMQEQAVAHYILSQLLCPIIVKMSEHLGTYLITLTRGVLGVTLVSSMSWDFTRAAKGWTGVLFNIPLTHNNTQKQLYAVYGFLASLQWSSLAPIQNPQCLGVRLVTNFNSLFIMKQKASDWRRHLKQSSPLTFVELMEILIFSINSFQWTCLYTRV